MINEYLPWALVVLVLAGLLWSLQKNKKLKLKLHNAEVAMHEIDEAYWAEQSRNIQLAKELERARREVMYDGLTGALSENSFRDIFAQHYSAAERQQCSSWLVMVDLDKFKSVNDTLGHAAGNEALKAFASLQANDGRASDVIARIHGDEFLLLLSGVEEASQVNAALQRLKSDYEASVDAIFQAHGQERPRDVSISYGYINLAQAVKDGLSDDDVLAEADHKMYEMKESNRG